MEPAEQKLVQGVLPTDTYTNGLPIDPYTDGLIQGVLPTDTYTDGLPTDTYRWN